MKTNRPGNSTVPVFYGESFGNKELLTQIEGVRPVLVEAAHEVISPDLGVVLLDRGLEAIAGTATALRSQQSNLMIIAEEGVEHGDFLVPRGWPLAFTLKALEAALREGILRVSRRVLRGELNQEHEKLFQLTNIGIALSAETDLNRLLTTILREGRNLACSDAASLFLIQKEEGEEAPSLVFKLTQNDSVSCPFKEQRFPLNKKSVAGFVAVTGEILNIPNVYEIAEEEPYSFNSSFDESVNYHSRSMLTIPMKNHNKEVTGVLQFINRKTTSDTLLTSREITEANTLPFSQDLTELLKALASQAAVAIENSLLLSRINHLFEGFVSASVTAIEQRDPTTSGHSFRVAELTTGLAQALPRSNCSYSDCSFDKNQIKEIRYASLLHDFGKVGVREPVLVKANKLPERGLDIIWHRFELFKERLRSRELEKRLHYVLEHGRDAYQERESRFEEELNKELEQFSLFYQEIAEANRPSILPEGRFSHLERIRALDSFQVGERELQLLTDEEFFALSVRKGSLTEDERREIESHVVHTFNFLKQIPWTPELNRVPELAYAHHEKLNGSGYPRKLTQQTIPLPSKMMTIADIYDALTASDRPYKKALPHERALDILTNEAKSGLLDGELVQVFVEARIFEHYRYDPSNESKASGPNFFNFNRGVCDHDMEH